MTKDFLSEDNPEYPDVPVRHKLRNSRLLYSLSATSKIPGYNFMGSMNLNEHEDFTCPVVELSDGRIASGSFDKTIGIWGK